MEFEDNEIRKLDLLTLVDDCLKLAKRFVLVAVALVLICSGLFTGRAYLGYRPVYTASASFTVRVANPLYSKVNSYNIKTAEQMSKTFPYIIGSGVLHARVKEHLGITSLGSISVSANANTSIITMSVKDQDPQRAYDVLNAVIECYPDVAEFVVGPTVLTLLDESGVPTHPSNPLNLTNALRNGIVVGAGLWVALILLLAMVRSTIHNEEELNKLLNTPCMGTLPSIRLSGKNRCPLITSKGHMPGFSESVRVLRVRVERAMAEQNKRVLLVSSAIPGEGKTTVSVNLALSLAKKGHRVLLIDCDLRNPSVAPSLQISPQLSMVDYLSEKSNVREVITPTKFQNLSIISGGSGKHPNATEMLSQERAQRLLYAARNLFDYVILDTPPCSLLADAAEIAASADCSLMVIRQDFASRNQILDGVQRLSDTGLPLIGCAINGISKSFAGHYGYGYGEKRKKK